MIEFARIGNLLHAVGLAGALLAASACSPTEPETVFIEATVTDPDPKPGPEPALAPVPAPMFFIHKHSDAGNVGGDLRIDTPLAEVQATDRFAHSVRDGDGPEYRAEWRYLGPGEDGEQFSVEYTVPQGSNGSATHATTATYTGERLVVFSDDDWEIGLGPESADEEE